MESVYILGLEGGGGQNREKGKGGKNEGGRARKLNVVLNFFFKI